MQTNLSPTIVIGAGPAGLATAYTLAKKGRTVTVVERNPKAGGLSSSFDLNGSIVDFGPHIINPHAIKEGSSRFKEIWNEILQNDQISLTRKTRMYWQGKYFEFPPQPVNLIGQLGLKESSRIMASFVESKLSGGKFPRNLTERMKKRYGSRIFSICFQAYIEKLFGTSTDQLRPDWTPGRLQSLSFMEMLGSILTGRKDGMISYPKRGSGQFYEKMVERIRALGQRVLFNRQVVRIEHDNNRIQNVVIERTDGGEQEILPCQGQLVSTMPIPLFVKALTPSPSPEIGTSFDRLKFRNTVLVYVVIDSPSLFDDHALYINDRSLKVGRIANFANWSPDMVPNKNLTPLCCEFWCDLGDAIWTMPEDQLVELTCKELQQLKLLKQESIVTSKVIRLSRTHPVPDLSCTEVDWSELEKIDNLQMIGRGGSFSYSDQDDSILMGLKAADQCLAQAN